jgi:hypothetical protein
MSSGDLQHHHQPTAEWHDLRRVAASRFADPRVKLALTRAHGIDQSFDIAYVAGISNDLRTLYVDRHFPLHDFDGAGDVTDELWLHECGEALFILLWRDSYFRAHKLITCVEHDLVVARGVGWNGYKAAFDVWDKRDEHEKIIRSPPDLFLEPYKQSGDWLLLKRIQDTMSNGESGRAT